MALIMILRIVAPKIRFWYFRVKNSRIFIYFVLDDMVLSKVSSYKYLGHVICEDFKNDEDFAREYRKMYAQGNSLIRKFYMCNEAVKTTLFRSFCISMYSSQL